MWSITIQEIFYILAELLKFTMLRLPQLRKFITPFELLMFNYLRLTMSMTRVSPCSRAMVFHISTDESANLGRDGATHLQSVRESMVHVNHQLKLTTTIFPVGNSETMYFVSGCQIDCPNRVFFILSVGTWPIVEVRIAVSIYSLFSMSFVFILVSGLPCILIQSNIHT